MSRRHEDAAECGYDTLEELRMDRLPPKQDPTPSGDSHHAGYMSLWRDDEGLCCRCNCVVHVLQMQPTPFSPWVDLCAKCLRDGLAVLEGPDTHRAATEPAPAPVEDA